MIMLAPAANILLCLGHITILWCRRPRSGKAISQTLLCSVLLALNFVFFSFEVILTVLVVSESSNSVATTISLCVHSTIHLLSPLMLTLSNYIKKEKRSLLIFFNIFLYFTVFISILVTLSGFNKEAVISSWDDTTSLSYISVIKLIFVALQLPINSLVYFLVLFPIMPHSTSKVKSGKSGWKRKFRLKFGRAQQLVNELISTSEREPDYDSIPV